MNLRECMLKAYRCHQSANSIKNKQRINIGWYCSTCKKAYYAKAIDEFSKPKI